LKKAPGSKKRKNKANGDSATASETKTSNGDASSKTTVTKDTPSAPSRSNTSTPTPSAPNGIKNASTAMLTARVLEEENEKKKRRKLMGANDNISSLFKKDSKDTQYKNTDFMTRGFSLPAASKK
jgi:hypothetical protein